ncbi:TetR/AcrR family transcriptional regulator [Rhizobium sp. 3T7]|uniref:TetR/AcrR family transcriptional regulator n=1 Tax=Rhizobium sp. 3T7 TaxID=2874922 RepID=UPI001CC90A95|nr:TetR/AcrR family transcriptional regulator [Rhizobium sp. 3T7]MBZ9793108.1 TetR/AcrR family transcriptional regulator [Rhizobium sp. 3T7]
MASAPPKTEPSTPPPMRADARRNREKLVDVAAAAFAEAGVETSLEDIARRAGVGIGTLYRHFPTREHLVEVVYRRELESLAAAARQLAASHAPDVALEEWMRRFVGYIAAKRGMATSLKILMDSNASLFAEGSGLLRGAVDGLLKAAAEQGLIRSDIDTTDLLHALSSIYSLPASPEWRDRSNRLIGLLMDGLRTQK